MPAATITTTAGPAFEIPRGSWGYRVYNNSDTVIYVLENATVLTTTGIPVRPGSERVVAFAERNQNPMTLQAIHGGSGSKNVRYEILTVQIQATTGAGESATLDASDLQIGAVEIKNGATDERASVEAANTARTTATKVLAVQHVGADGNPMASSPVLGAGSAAIGSVKDGGTAFTTSLGVTGARVTSADQSAAVASITDAPTSGQKIVIDDVLFSSDTALRLDFSEETTGTILFSVYLSAGSSGQFTPRGKLKLATADKKLQWRASAAGNIAVTPLYHSEA